jgi:hypothetical protein
MGIVGSKVGLFVEVNLHFEKIVPNRWHALPYQDLGLIAQRQEDVKWPRDCPLFVMKAPQLKGGIDLNWTDFRVGDVEENRQFFLGYYSLKLRCRLSLRKYSVGEAKEA